MTRTSVSLTPVERSLLQRLADDAGQKPGDYLVSYVLRSGAAGVVPAWLSAWHQRALADGVKVLLGASEVWEERDSDGGLTAREVVEVLYRDRQRQIERYGG